MFAVGRVGLFALVGLAALWTASAGAQQVYRIVGPDGRVTFSDRPPADPAAKAAAAPTMALSSSPNAALPFELRNVTNRYPVTLYTGQDCGACVNGRAFLASRGIPFTERTVTSDDDIEALKRMSGAARLPLLTIGAQQLKGYSESEWSQYLDAAGYPKTSQLPSSYRNPAATPLVAVQAPPPRPTAAAPQQQPQQAVAPQQSSEPPPPNPAGIRF
jgi:glutaredoxin